jgi:hypothetical protein
MVYMLALFSNLLLITAALARPTRPGFLGRRQGGGRTARATPATQLAGASLVVRAYFTDGRHILECKWLNTALRRLD